VVIRTVHIHCTAVPMLFRTVNYIVQAFITSWNELFPSHIDISASSVLSVIAWQFYPPSDHLHMWVQQDFASALKPDDTSTSTNFADILTVSTATSVTKLHATCTYFQTAHWFCTPLCSLYISLPFTLFLQKDLLSCL